MLNVQMRWNEMVSPLCEGFETLCSQHNAAEITLRDFQQQRSGLQGAARRLTELRRALDDALEAYRRAKDQLAACAALEPERQRAAVVEARAQGDDARRRAMDALEEARQSVSTALDRPAEAGPGLPDRA
jgi:exonuclease VII small subunit